MTRWGMVIDLHKCVGCKTCSAVCYQMNELPSDIYWRQVYDIEIAGSSGQERMFLPSGCMHCDEPPCLEVCPTTATYRRPDGIVDIKYELCIGCSYCVVACPYLARHITSVDNRFYYHSTINDGSSVSAKVDHSGVCTKCNFCSLRVDAGLRQGLKPGLDMEATPLCVAFCASKALTFGDFDDPSSEVSGLIEGRTALRLSEKMETKPSIYYLMDGAALRQDSKEEIALVKPLKQQVWKGPAAANFILGGMGTGLYLLILIMGSLGFYIPDFSKFIAVGLTALGFISLVFEAGRPSRFIHLMKHLRRSWMSREVLMGSIFILVAVVDMLYPQPVFQWIAAAAAIGLMLSQGFIFYRARAVPAWNMPLMPLLFIASNIMMASGLMLALYTLGGFFLSESMMIASLTCVVVDLIIWLSYLYRRQDRTFQESTKSLRSPGALAIHVGLGHVLPIFLLALSVIDLGGGEKLELGIVGLAGLLVIAGGVVQRIGIILKAGYLSAIVY